METIAPRTITKISMSRIENAYKVKTIIDRIRSLGRELGREDLRPVLALLPYIEIPHSGYGWRIKYGKRNRLVMGNYRIDAGGILHWQEEGGRKLTAKLGKWLRKRIQGVSDPVIGDLVNWIMTGAHAENESELSRGEVLTYKLIQDIEISGKQIETTLVGGADAIASAYEYDSDYAGGRMGSCMAGKFTRGYLDIYAENGNVIKACHAQVYKDGECLGTYARCLVWIQEREVFVDRGYPSSRQAFIHKEAKKLLLGQGYQAENIRFYNSAPQFDTIENLKAPSSGRWPYMDTFGYCQDYSRNRVCLSTDAFDSGVYYELKETGGDRTQCGYEYTCNDCGCGLDEDDCYSDDNGNCYCADCFSRIFTTCERCGDTISREDCVSAGDYDYCDSRCANRDGFYECAECGDYYHEDDLITLQDEEGDTTQMVCDNCLGYMKRRLQAGECAECGAGLDFGNGCFDYCLDCRDSQRQSALNEYCLAFRH